MADLTKAIRIRSLGIAISPGIGFLTFDFTPYLQGKIGIITRLIAAIVQVGVPVIPSWDAYIGDPNDAKNLVDSSQGQLLPRWVPALTNGQPIRNNETLTIIAKQTTPGTKLISGCYLALVGN